MYCYILCTYTIFIIQIDVSSFYSKAIMEKKRLQSIKFPRDLTLGGTKPKKTFTPNLNVVRNKEKGKEAFIKTEDSRKRNHKKDFKNNKKFERPERFVQSSGIFSDGMGNDVNRKVRYEKVYAPRDDTPSVMPLPKVKKDEWQVDNKNETRVYDDIMGGNDASDDENMPFAPVSWNEADLKELKVPNKPEIKLEGSETIKINLDRLKIENGPTPKEFLDTECFTDYKPSLNLWSMPDSFAGKGLSDDPNVKTLFDYKLSEMLEGQVGKMVIRKSGKHEVYIGCVKYEIEREQLETFSEKIVEVHLKNPSETTGVALGQLQSRYILNPDWTFLITDS